MNQILDYSQNTNKSTSSNSYRPSGGGGNYNNGAGNRRPNMGSDKIVRVFAILIALLAVAFIAMGLYGSIQNKKEEDTNKKQEAKEEATIQLIADEDASTLKIKVSHTKNIEKVIYMWNNNREKELKAQGKPTLEEEIALPIGQNTLTIKVIDVEGEETIKEEVFNASKGVDITSPVLSLVPEGNKLKITATDDREIAKVTYKWSNSEETMEVLATEDGQKELVVEVDIQRGENDILVTAIDKAGMVTTDSRTYKGVTVPEIGLTVSSDGTVATLRVTHEVGVTAIKIILNGEEFNVDGLDGTQTDVSVEVSLPDPTADNNIKVVAESAEGTSSQIEDVIKYQAQNPPVIEVTQDGANVHAVFKAEEGILKAELFMQEQTYTVTDLEANPKEAFVDFEIPQGTTRIVLTMTDLKGQEAVFDKELTN